MANYNPYILGFVRQDGMLSELWIPLQMALEQFGDLPSHYGLLPSEQRSRRNRTVLNLALGTCINHILGRIPDLKRDIHAFYHDWHRDWKQEFGVDAAPLFNRTEAQLVVRWLDFHRDFLQRHERFDIRKTLDASGLIRRDILNSIADQDLPAKAIQMLQRRYAGRLRSGAGGSTTLQNNISRLRIREMLDRLSVRIGQTPSLIDTTTATIYADEISQTLRNIGEETEEVRKLQQSDSGQEIQFSYASRDSGMLTLGSDIGDCTAKPFKQLDVHTENIYWTVYPWMLDRNYLILKVHYAGHLVLKIHLLPLAAYESGGVRIFLAVDAIETGISMRHDIPGEHHIPADQCREILEQALREIVRISDAMGITDIYAELFSNNPLVREWLEGFEKSYLDVTRLHKVDDLEDVFTLAGKLAAEYGEPEPDHVFMEIQFRNTQLMSHQTPRTHIKGFARMRRGSLSGLAMGKVIGV